MVQKVMEKKKSKVQPQTGVEGQNPVSTNKSSAIRTAVAALLRLTSMKRLADELQVASDKYYSQLNMHTKDTVADGVK